MNQSIAPDGPSATQPRRSGWPRSVWWLLLAIPLILVGIAVAGVVWAIVGGESADADVRAVESAPAPAGAVVVEQSSDDGSFEQGPEARIVYHLPAGATPVQVCVGVLDELRADGWAMERWGTSPGPDPSAAEAFCSELDEEGAERKPAVILDASKDGTEPIVAVLSLNPEAPGGLVLAYSSR